MTPADPRTAIVAPLYLAPPEWYAACASFARVVVDTSMRYERNFKAILRTVIGRRDKSPLTLSASVSHSQGASPLSQLLLSDHDRWWEKHARSIATAYGGTPWFEHLWPLLSPLYDDRLAGTPLTDFTLALDTRIRAIIGFDTPFTVPLDDSYDDSPEHPYISPRSYDPDTCVDLRHTDFYAPVPDSTPALSILDPLFTLGPGQTRRLILSLSRLQKR